MHGGAFTNAIKKLYADRRVRAVVLALLALLLLVLLWHAFFGGTSSAYQGSEEEQKLARLLESLDGVERATVMISLDKDTPVSAVVVFEGTDSLTLRLKLLSATASALNLSQKAVQIYAASA